jgi:two-component system nitrogen regulation response regulator NtrX
VYSLEALTLLAQHRWPGNIRELANLVERLAILGGEVVGPDEVRLVLPAVEGAATRRTPSPAPRATATEGTSLTDALDEYERELIGAALTQADGNVAEAARVLQTDRANLYRRMKRLGLVARGETVG